MSGIEASPSERGGVGGHVWEEEEREPATQHATWGDGVMNVSVRRATSRMCEGH